MISFVEDPQEPLWHGLGLVAIMCSVEWAYTLVFHQYIHRMFSLGMNCRAILVNAIFVKVSRSELS